MSGNRPLASLAAAESRTSASTRIGRNVSFRLVSQVLWALSNVVALSLLGNYLHAEGYGQYAFYYALIPLIGAFGDLGVGIMVTRDLARDAENGPRLFGDAILLKGLISGAVFLVSVVTAWSFFPPTVAWLICLVAAAALVEIAQDPSIWVLRARERQDLEALLLVVSQVVWLGGLFAGVLLQLPLSWFLGVQTAAFLVRLAVGAYLVRRSAYRPVFRPNWTRIRSWIRQGLPYGLSMFGVVLHGRVAVLLLQSLASTRDVAWFNVAYNLSQPFGFISTALSMSAFPVIARYAASNPEALRQALRKACRYQVMVSLPIMTALFLLSERLIPLLFHGDDFGKAGLALRITSLALAFIFLNLMSRYFLAALDRQQTYLKSILAGLAVNAGLCLLLIPRLGFMGACVAYLGAELTIFATCQAALSRHMDWTSMIRDAGRPLAAAVGMAVAILALGSLNVILTGVIGAVVYVALLVALRALSSQELSLLKGVYVSFRLPGSAYLSRAGQRT